MDHVPVYVALLFGLTTILAVFLFYRAAGKSKTTLLILLAWLILQGLVALSGFYQVTDTIPPRFGLLVGPALLLIIGLFIFPKGRQYLDGLDQKTLTLLHVVRIPVEIVLYLLFVYKAVPELMTFAGRNFDILAGISAPIVYYFAFGKKNMGRTALLIWNFICLGLLINIVVNAVLSAPFPFQQFGLDQPNIAVLYFPFNWLPCCVVPLVALSHLASIRQLLRMRNSISAD